MRWSASLLRTTEGLPGRLWGIGIGVPGPVEFEAGRPISPPIMPGWDGYPIRERFAARYGAPVWVDNDVNVLALGEWRSGVAAGHDNVVVVKIGTGVGAGIISDGHLHRAPGQCRRRRPHPGHGRSGRRLPLRQHRLPGGARRRRGAGPGGRGGRPGRPQPAAAGRTGSARIGDRGGRRPRGVVRRSGGDGPAAGRRSARRLDARERRELLQPVADRHRRRRRQQPGPVPGVDPRDGLPTLAAAGDARPARPALVARRPRRRHRGVVDGRRPALLARVDRPLDRPRRPVRRRGRSPRRPDAGRGALSRRRRPDP